jgi:hypothetical protein
MTRRWREEPLVRPHVITGGRARPTRNALDLVTLVVATGSPHSGLSPEKRRVMRLCQDGALSVAEIAGHLTLPVTVTKVLLSDLIDDGHLAVRGPRAEQPDMRLLQDLLDGLRARL